MSGEWAIRKKKKGQDRKSRSKNKRGGRKEEPNDSPEIPGRERHQTSPASLRRWAVSPYAQGDFLWILAGVRLLMTKLFQAG